MSPLTEQEIAVFPKFGSLKKMVRLLYEKRRLFLEQDFKKHNYKIQKSQYNQLMLIRFIMPCNLGKIMAVTGLTSAGASIFVEKMVQQNILHRQDDPNDRRNVLISLTPEGKDFLAGVDDRLDEFILGFFRVCPEEYLKVVAKAVDIISGILDTGHED